MPSRGVLRIWCAPSMDPTPTWWDFRSANSSKPSPPSDVSLSTGRCSRIRIGLAVLAATVPMQTLAGDGTNDYLDYLANDLVLLAILISNSFLLLGFLIRLRYLRKNLTRTKSTLEQTEEYSRIMGDNLPNIAFFQLEHSLESGFVFRSVSKGYEEVMGIDCHRVLNDAKLAFDHLYEADLPVLKQTYRQCKERLEPIDLNLRFLDIEGNLKWLHISAVPHPEDNCLIWNGVMQDITEGKSLEAALTEEKLNFQNLFETIDDFMLVCDMNGKLLHTNPSVELHLEYSGGALDGMSLLDLYQKDYRTEVYQIISLMQSEISSTCGLPFLSRTGSTIPVEMNLFQGSWQNSKAIFCVARDTTLRRQTETALRESQQMLRLIMDTIPMSVFWKNKDSEYLGCNTTFLQECRFKDPDEVIGKTPYDLFELETAANLVSLDQQVVATNQPMLNTMLPYNRLDGTTGQREASKIPLQNEEGQAVGVLEVWRDVTEQNQSEDRLKRTLEDMERFNQLMRGRERRTLELKSEINHLLMELGRNIKYQTVADERS